MRNSWLRLAKAEPYLSVKFQQQLFESISTGPSPSQSCRTIQQMLDTALRERTEAEKRQQQAMEVKRIQSQTTSRRI